MKNKICFCLVGWHFHENVYRRLFEAVNADIFVVAHKERERLPAFLFEKVPESRIIFRENIGYDWGSYQQFITTGFWQDYDFIFFMHDDLEIKNLDFVPHSIDLLQAGKKVVGNGRNSQHLNWPQTHLFCYGHSTWLPPSRQFQHDTVRGSFFTMKGKTLEQTNKLEIFWDPHHLNVRFGNHSLIATCGKIQSLFGDDSFGFLGDCYLESNYITEYERGGQDMRSSSLTQRVVVNFYNKFSSSYVNWRMSNRQEDQVTQTLGRVIGKINGVHCNKQI